MKKLFRYIKSLFNKSNKAIEVITLKSYSIGDHNPLDIPISTDKLHGDIMNIYQDGVVERIHG